MKKAKISPLPADQNKKILIGDELTRPERVEYICSQCNTNTLVTITDQAGNGNLFCKLYSAVFDPQDNTVRHKHRLTVLEETEPAVSIVNVDLSKDVEIRHQPTLKDGAAQLAKRGTIKFTYYYDSSEH